VVGCADPFPQVSGNGIQKLRAAGITVKVGVLEKECREINKRFVCFQEQQRPYIMLKWAQTADGKIAGENFRRIAISNEYTARLVHRWRSQNMSILVGTNTALFDDPELTTRLWPGRNPTRLVLDKTLRLPSSLKLFDGQHPTIVFNTIRKHQHPNLLYYRLNGHEGVPQQVVQALYAMKIQSVLVEGGTQLLQSFIDADMWDEAVVITNQELALKGGVAAPQLQHHRLIQMQTIFSDTIHTFAHNCNLLI
jgi:diaminohydroxyphosphoribosylaminopyrimidine deaminase/5-amino-6-(5-phosphoribosylamino)uracil reductase